MSIKSSLLSPEPSARQLAIATTLLRVVTGAIFVAHGGQKLFVYGLAGVSGAFAQMGVPMASVVGPFIAFVEFLGGIALILGLLTRVAASGIAATMIGAILLVHLKAGFFNPGGVEFPLSLLSASLVIVLTGAGPWSVDAALSSPSRNDSAQKRSMSRAA